MIIYLFPFLLSRNLRLARAADAVDIQSKAVLVETLQLQVVDGLAYFSRLDFRHLAAYRTHLMAVAVVVVAGLVVRGSLKTVANNQTQFQEQLQRVVQRGTTHGKVILVGQLLTQFVQGEMPVHPIHRVQYGIAFRRLAVVVQFQIIRQYRPDGFLHILLHLLRRFSRNHAKVRNNYEL